MKRRAFRTLFCAFAASFSLAFGAAGEAAAHRTSLANIDLSVEDARVLMQWTTSAHDLAVALGIETDLTTPIPRARFEERRAAIEAYVRQRAIIRSDGADCALSDVRIGYEKLPEQLVIDAGFDCPQAPATLTVRYGFYFDIDPQHLGVGQIRFGGGSQEVAFDASFMEVTVDLGDESSRRSAWDNFTVYLWFGTQHILGGYDHIMFLMALIVVMPRMWDTIKIVTAFTIAHSVTLTLAWFDIVDLPSRLVESAIAFSIAYVALENLLRERPTGRWMLAGFFGLVHGLAFYGALRAFDTNPDNTLIALFSFNLGVEIGQLAIVLLAYAPLYYCARHPWFPRAARAASLAMFTVAVWWFMERAIGA